MPQINLMGDYVPYPAKFCVKKIAPNKASTRRVGFCGIFKHFSGFEYIQNAAQPGCQADWRSAPTNRAAAV